MVLQMQVEFQQKKKKQNDQENCTFPIFGFRQHCRIFLHDHWNENAKDSERLHYRTVRLLRGNEEGAGEPPDPVHSLYIFNDYAPICDSLSCVSLVSLERKSDNFCPNNLIFVHPSQRNPGCVSGSIHHCCRYIFQAVVGRRRNKLRNASSLLGLSFLRHNYRIVKIAHIGSRTRSDD